MARKLIDNINVTRPDITVNYRPSGSYIIKDGKLVPNLKDDAMKEREIKRLEEEKAKQTEKAEEENGESKKSDSDKD